MPRAILKPNASGAHRVSERERSSYGMTTRYDKVGGMREHAAHSFKLACR